MIQDIVKKGLCTQCGTCQGVCPNENIKMTIDKKGEWFPAVGNNCNKCLTCVNSCPGGEVDFNKLNEEIFGKLPSDICIGNFRKCYIGYSKDSRIRMNSSSGGIVTSLGIYLLQHKLVDGVVVAMDTDDPLHPKPFIARNSAAMVQAMQSKYVSIPINTMIRKVLNEKGRFAFVGLPCQIHGLRKAEMINKKIKAKIKYKIGLFCSFAPELEGVKFLIRQTGIKDVDQVKRIRFREGKWPGNFVVTSKNGGVFALPFEYYYYPLLLPFYKMRCLKCVDLANELADVSVGDAWQLRLRGEEGGFAVIVDRRLKEDLAKIVTIEQPISETDVIRTQKLMLSVKKDSLSEKTKMFNDFPDYNIAGLDKQNGSFNKVLRYVRLSRFLYNVGILDELPHHVMNLYLKRIARFTN